MNDLDQAVSQALKLYPQGEAKPEQATPFSDLDTAVDFALKTSTPYTKKINKFQQFLQQGAALADVTVGGVIPGVAGPLTYAVTRPFTTAEGAKKAEEAVLGVTAQPFGKALGITESPYYKGEALNQLMSFVGENASKGADWISQQTGVPKTDIENMMQSLGLGVGAKVAPAMGKATTKAVGAAEGAMQAAFEKVQPVVSEALKKAEPYTPFEVQEVAKLFQKQPTVQDVTSGRVSAGAAATSKEAIIRSAIAELPPDEAAAISKLAINDVDVDALKRRVEASQLGIKLSTGQASQSPKIITKELNTRGKPGAELTPEMLNQQNKQLISSLDTLREEVAPNAYGKNKLEHGQNIIDAYREIDARLRSDIDAKYDALRQAAGGEFPIDVKTLYSNTEGTLRKQLLYRLAEKDLPEFKELSDLAKSGKMDFETFQYLRQNLGTTARTHRDGNVRKAASLMIDELEKLPLSQETTQLKGLATDARNAARNRFEMLEKDPAMKAAVLDKVPAEKFADKFVVRGVNKNVQQMIQNLGQDSPAHHSMRVAAIENLKESAGIKGDLSNFSQSGFNKELKRMNDIGNVNVVFGPETGNKLRAVGNVAAYTQYQPKGSFVNTSNTATALEALRGQAGKALQVGGDIVGLKTVGVPFGTIGKTKLEEMKTAAETQKTWAPGAGVKKQPLSTIKLQDIGKKKD